MSSNSTKEMNYSGRTTVEYKRYRVGNHNHINFSLQQIITAIAELAITGRPVQLRDKTNVDVNLVIGNFCAHLPELKHMFCVQYRNKSNEHCQRCHVKRDKLETYPKLKNLVPLETLGLQRSYQRYMYSYKEKKKTTSIESVKKTNQAKSNSAPILTYLI